MLPATAKLVFLVVSTIHGPLWRASDRSSWVTAFFDFSDGNGGLHRTAVGRQLPVANSPVSDHSPMEQGSIWNGAGQDEQYDGQQPPAQRSIQIGTAVNAYPSPPGLG